jgi:hypothetical protein
MWLLFVDEIPASRVQLLQADSVKAMASRQSWHGTGGNVHSILGRNRLHLFGNLEPFGGIGCIEYPASFSKSGHNLLKLLVFSETDSEILNAQAGAGRHNGFEEGVVTMDSPGSIPVAELRVNPELNAADISNEVSDRRNGGDSIFPGWNTRFYFGPAHAGDGQLEADLNTLALYIHQE